MDFCDTACDDGRQMKLSQEILNGYHIRGGVRVLLSKR
jgi:hypothetical protein